MFAIRVMKMLKKSTCLNENVHKVQIFAHKYICMVDMYG